MQQTEYFNASEYEELYPIDERSQVVLIHKLSKKLYLRKERANYDISVYDFLKSRPHPNICEVHDYWEEDGKLIVLEEFIEGKTLKELLSSNSTSLTDAEKLRIIDSVCDGLSFLHHADPPIIHRDLKTSNIMITAGGTIRLIDYDAAKVYKNDHSEDTIHIGTPGIAAPEQYGFAQSDARTDIYALGKLTEVLFPNNDHYRSVVHKATEIDPRNRYQNVEDFRSALHGGLSRKTILWLLVAATIVLFLSAAFMLNHFDQRDTDEPIVSENNNEASTDSASDDLFSSAIEIPEADNADTPGTNENDTSISENDVNDSVSSDEIVDPSESNEAADKTTETELSDADADPSENVPVVQDSDTNNNGNTDLTSGTTSPSAADSTSTDNSSATTPADTTPTTDSSILTAEQVAQITAPVNEQFYYWGITFSIPYYYSGLPTRIGYAFSGPNVGSLAFVTNQDYFSGGYHVLSENEIRQIATDWAIGHNGFTITSSYAITIAGYSGYRINFTKTYDSGRISYTNLVVFYDAANNTTRIIHHVYDQTYTTYPLGEDFNTIISGAYR